MIDIIPTHPSNRFCTHISWLTCHKVSLIRVFLSCHPACLPAFPWLFIIKALLHAHFIFPFPITPPSHIFVYSANFFMSSSHSRGALLALSKFYAAIQA